MRSQSLKRPTVEDHEATRRKYVTLSWDLWRGQYEEHFFVWHPIPEEHLRIELALFWRGEISHIHGWNNVIGQAVEAIMAPIRAALSWLWENLIRPGVDVLFRLLRGAMDLWFNFVRGILNGITSAVAGVTSWLASVGNTILNVVNSVLAQLAQGIAGLASAISGVITTIINSVQAGLAGLSATVSQGLSWLGTELTKATSWIWDQMSGLFSALGEVLKQIGTWIINAIRTHVVDPLLVVIKGALDVLHTLISAIFNFITQGAVAGSPIEWRGSYMRWIGIISGVGVMAVSGLIGAKLIDVIHPFKDTNISDIAKFAIQFSGVAFLQSAFFTTYFDIACAKPVRQELNAIFTPEIPGSGDLIRFVVREVIKPDEFHLALSLQGFSKYWSEAYWEAHWMLPPTERTRTAFLRKDIPEAEYRKFLIWYDFKPDPRPGISLSDVDIMLKTQYSWPGRIDTRWLVEWGIIDEAAGLELIKAGGMDPAWAPRVLEAYMLNQLREELGKVRGVYERRLRAGFMSKEGFAEALHGIHFAVHVINALLKWADAELDLDEKVELAKEYESLAKAGAITVDAYGEDLRKLGMVEARITRKQNHIRRLLEIKAAKEAAKTAEAE